MATMTQLRVVYFPSYAMKTADRAYDYSARIVERYREKVNLPVVFFTQLMGVAFGESARCVKLQEMTTDAYKVIRWAGFA